MAASDKQFAAIAGRVVIYPDKLVLNVKYDYPAVYSTLSALQSAVPSPAYGDAYAVGAARPYRVYVWDGTAWYDNGLELAPMEASWSGSLTFGNGSYAGEEAEANAVYNSAVDWSQYFSVGDGVFFSGCARHKENNANHIIREISEDKHTLYFSEYALTLDDGYTVGQDGLAAGVYWFDDTESGKKYYFTLPAMGQEDKLLWTGAALTKTVGGASSAVSVSTTEPSAKGTKLALNEEIPYGEPGNITISRDAPELDFIMGHDNRVWGCKGSDIFCSKAGDPMNWYCFEAGISTASWSTAVASPGDFTACYSYGGYPLFFKENIMYKIYGDEPGNYETYDVAAMGVTAGSDKSLAVAGEVLFWHSPAGIVAYSGAAPAVIGSDLAVFGRSFQQASAGSDGLKYYVSMQDRAGNWHLFVYDTTRNLWHREDALQVSYFCYCQRELYALAVADGGYAVWLLGRPKSSGGTTEDGPAFAVEFADFYDAPNKKATCKVLLRLEIDAGASLNVYAQFDSSGTWELAHSLTSRSKQSCLLPLVLHRCDHYRLMLTGSGEFTLYSMSRDIAAGSAL